jgi:ABC-type oligopeptide transport system ATPase subunit
MLLRCEDITKQYALKEGVWGGSRVVKALDSVNIEINENETLGLVGESGSGKSTLGRVILRLTEPDSGKIFFKGDEISGLDDKKLKPYRKNIQAIFQDPYSSLNPRLRIIESLREPLEIHSTLSKPEIMVEVEKMLTHVGIQTDEMYKYPHELSGGQKQRINIARALILKPSLIIADEPVSSLDVSIQAQILNLFMDLKAEYKFSTLFISHDLRIVRHISDRIAVISQGKIVETGTAMEIFEKTTHSYTKMLISSMPEKKIAQKPSSRMHRKDNK